MKISKPLAGRPAPPTSTPQVVNDPLQDPGSRWTIAI